jgi:CheY-like chemotaxis protein
MDTARRLLLIDDEPQMRSFLSRVAQGCGYEVRNTDDAAGFKQAYSNLRRVVAKLLGDLGYRVIEVGDAAGALDILAKEPSVRLLFTDVVMPGMDGRDLAREAMTRRPSLKVLLTSGFPESRVEREGQPLRNIRLLSKPYRKEELAQTVRALLDDETPAPLDGPPSTTISP